MKVTHCELQGFITALTDGRKIAVADQLRLATDLMNTRAALWEKNARVNELLWQIEQGKEEKQGE